MNSFDFGNQAFGFGGGAKSGDGDKLAGTAQAAEHIFTKVGMIPHSRQRQRVQHLHQQGADAPAQHRGKIVVHLPDNRLRAEQARIPRRIFKINVAERQPGQADDLFFYRCAYHFHPDWPRLASGGQCNMKRNTAFNSAGRYR